MREGKVTGKSDRKTNGKDHNCDNGNPIDRIAINNFSPKDESQDKGNQ